MKQHIEAAKQRLLAAQEPGTIQSIVSILRKDLKAALVETKECSMDYSATHLIFAWEDSDDAKSEVENTLTGLGFKKTMSKSLYDTGDYVEFMKNHLVVRANYSDSYLIVVSN